MHKLFATLACAAISGSISFAFSSPALAEKVGVAAAVKPEALSTPPGAETRTLKLGNAVVYNERIETSASGIVQVLLLDGSTFTVGPDSSLVIDRFVYDPKRGTASLVATYSKGALRFVGGKVSKNQGGVTIRTPTGTLTVRGGIFQGLIKGPNNALFQFVFGDELSLWRGRTPYSLFKAGNTIAVKGSGAPSLYPTPPEELALVLAAISGKPTRFARGKGHPFPHYYGFHPTGWPDQPFVENWIDFIGTDRARSSLTPINSCTYSCYQIP